MKYIQRFIKSLLPDITEKKSNMSNSVYYKLGKDDRIFSIRCSDHFSPIKGFKSNEIEIIKVLGKEDFIVLYCGYNTPMLKSRKEVKDFIKTAYDIYCMKSMVKESDEVKLEKKAEKIAEELSPALAEKWKSYTDKIAYILKREYGYGRCSTWSAYMSIISRYCKLPLSKNMKTVLRSYYDNETFNNDEITTIMFNLQNLEPKRSLSVEMVKQYCHHMIALKEKGEKKC